MKRRVNLACCIALALWGCGADDGPSDSGVTLDAGGADAGPAVDAGPEPCESWLIEYSLQGSEFEIRNTLLGAGDAINTIGPGRARLRFSGDDTGPKAGPVLLLDYEMKMDFDVAMVVTDITTTAGPDDCGVAMGTRTSSVVTWSSPVRGYRSQGTVTCGASEFLCGAAGLPQNMPVAQDSTSDQALMPFVFEGPDSFASFTMSEVEVPNDDAGDTFLRLSGVEVSRRCAAIPPDCN